MTNRRTHIDWLNHGVEFLVVIIGILIAFQLNQYASERQQIKTVNTHLEQLKEETKFNKWSLESALTQGEINMAKFDTIFLLLNEGKDFERINLLTIDLLNLGGVYFRKNAYQNLVESGDIRFIHKFEIKENIINLYEYYKWVESFDEISRELYMQDFYPYLKNNFDLISARVQDENVYQTRLFKNILGAYRRTSENRIQKYRDCIKEIDDYLNSEKEF
jgi:hypothetical protein